jgi:protein SCO1/2
MNAARLALAAAVVLASPALAAGAPDRVQKQRDWFTNSVLVAQDGREVRFFDDVLQDQVVVIQFMFTRCTSACPLLTRKLVEAKAALGGSIPEGVRFVSLSVDPKHDGPAELRAFAERQGAAVPRWILLGGRKERVDLVARKLGQTVDAPEDHATLFIAGNARTNHWLRIRPDAPGAVIAQQIRQLLAEEGPVASAEAAK